AVVDFPTPPLPEATAMTAAMPGISDCFDIGDAGLCGGLCEATGATPGAWRCGGGAAAPGLRSAVSAIIATATPGMARTAASAWLRTLSHARASAASTLIEKNTLPSLTDIADNTLASLKATPPGDATLAKASRTCCCVTLNAHLLEPLSALIESEPGSIVFVTRFLPQISPRNLRELDCYANRLPPRIECGPAFAR